MKDHPKRIAKLEQRAKRAGRQMPRLIVVEPRETKEQARARLGFPLDTTRDFPDMIVVFSDSPAGAEDKPVD